MSIGHGGTRDGAGRKPRLSFEEQLWVFGECELLANEEQERNISARFASKTKEAGPHLDYPMLMPAKDRSAWLDSFEFEQHQEDLEDAL